MAGQWAAVLGRAAAIAARPSSTSTSTPRRLLFSDRLPSSHDVRRLLQGALSKVPPPPPPPATGEGASGAETGDAAPAAGEGTVGELEDLMAAVMVNDQLPDAVTPRHAALVGAEVLKGRATASSAEAAEHIHLLAAQIYWLAAKDGDPTGKFGFALLTLKVLPEPPKEARAYAVDCLKFLAKNGHQESAHFLGTMYRQGEAGLPRDELIAFDLFQVSSPNHPPSCLALGEMYMQGAGTDVDHAEAFKCFSRLPAAEFPQAQIGLAALYSQGLGVEVDHAKAFAHNLAAAEQGWPIGQFNVGVHHFAGKGCEQSLDKAREYFELAGEQGFDLALINLGNMYASGTGVEVDYDRALGYYERAAPTNEQARSLVQEVKDLKARQETSA